MYKERLSNSSGMEQKADINEKECNGESKEENKSAPIEQTIEKQ